MGRTAKVDENGEKIVTARKASKRYLVAVLPEGTTLDDVNFVALTTKSDEAMEALASNPGAVFKVFE